MVLGLLALDGPATPYELKQRVAGGIGNFWSFPHTQLYSEPPRLCELGLARESREQGGRRRRTFAITAAGRAALSEWLATPWTQGSEIRDPGLLQLAFSGLASAEERARLAAAQESVHARKLAAYESIAAATGEIELDEAHRWRLATLGMGLAHEKAAVAFWREIARQAATD